MLSGPPTQDAFTKPADFSVSGAAPSREVMSHVIDGLKGAERAQYLYERIERVETRKQAGDADPQSVRISRVIPAGNALPKNSPGRVLQPPHPHPTPRPTPPP